MIKVRQKAAELAVAERTYRQRRADIEREIKNGT